MATIRRKSFSASGDRIASDSDLVDTPEKLLRFAESKSLNSVPLDIDKVAKLFGILVKYVPIKDDLSGILYKDKEQGCWVIHVNQNHHPNRQRYTIAHELGHYCLHKHLKDKFEDDIFFRGGKSDKEEWQANDFASAILMPEQEFRKEVRKGQGKVDILAIKFKVSTLALRIRAKNLGMSGHGL